MRKQLRQALSEGRFRAVCASRSRAMAAVRASGNKSTELAVRMTLVRRGIRGWRMHNRAMIGRPDFFFSIQRVAVFIDGCFWHGCPRCGHVPRANRKFWLTKIRLNRARDKEVVHKLVAAGNRIIRIWEHEVKAGPGVYISRIEKAISSQ